jgi:hypothetical protein
MLQGYGRRGIAAAGVAAVLWCTRLPGQPCLLTRRCTRCHVPACSLGPPDGEYIKTLHTREPRRCCRLQAILLQASAALLSVLL